MGFDDSIISDYIAESREHLSDIEGDLLTMEGMGEAIDAPLSSIPFHVLYSTIMEPDGYLVIGSTESLTGLCPGLEPKRYLRSVFYQLPGAA